MTCPSCGRPARTARTKLARDVEFSADDLMKLRKFDLEPEHAEEVVDRLSQGAGLDEIAAYLNSTQVTLPSGVQRTPENHPLKADPLYWFLSYQGEGDTKTIIYHPEDEAFRLQTPNFVYGDLDGEIVNEYMRERFEGGIDLEREVGLEVSAEDEADLEAFADDLANNEFEHDSGAVINFPAFQLLDKRDERGSVSADGGGPVEIEVDGDTVFNFLSHWSDIPYMEYVRNRNFDPIMEELGDVAREWVMETLEDVARDHDADLGFAELYR